MKKKINKREIAEEDSYESFSVISELCYSSALLSSPDVVHSFLVFMPSSDTKNRLVEVIVIFKCFPDSSDG